MERSSFSSFINLNSLNNHVQKWEYPSGPCQSSGCTPSQSDVSLLTGAGAERPGWQADKRLFIETPPTIAARLKEHIAPQLMNLTRKQDWWESSLASELSTGKPPQEMKSQFPYQTLLRSEGPSLSEVTAGSSGHASVVRDTCHCRRGERKFPWLLNFMALKQITPG